jgi:hypothetical protein
MELLMEKLNCWECKKCGKEPGGAKIAELGVCPAATERRADGINNGMNGGRVCWAIAGTFCRGEIQGTYAMKLLDCLKCDFYQLVSKEEMWNFKTGEEILKKIGATT